MPVGFVHVREVVSKRQSADVKESGRVLGRVGDVRKHVARVPVAAAALQEPDPRRKAHEQERDRVERVPEVLVRGRHARRGGKEAFQRRPPGLHEKPAAEELDVREEKLEARELIGEPKVCEADVVKGRRENFPLPNARDGQYIGWSRPGEPKSEAYQNLHEPLAGRVVKLANRLDQVHQQEADERQRVNVVLYSVVSIDHERHCADEPEQTEKRSSL